MIGRNFNQPNKLYYLPLLGCSRINMINFPIALHHHLFNMCLKSNKHLKSFDKPGKSYDTLLSNVLYRKTSAGRWPNQKHAIGQLRMSA